MIGTINLLKDRKYFGALIWNVKKYGASTETIESALDIFLQEDSVLEDQWIKDIHNMGMKAVLDAVVEEIRKEG